MWSDKMCNTAQEKTPFLLGPSSLFNHKGVLSIKKSLWAQIRAMTRKVSIELSDFRKMHWWVTYYSLNVEYIVLYLILTELTNLTKTFIFFILWEIHKFGRHARLLSVSSPKETQRIIDFSAYLFSWNKLQITCVTSLFPRSWRP